MTEKVYTDEEIKNFWPNNPSVPFRPRPVRLRVVRSGIETVSLKRLRSALDAIPNQGAESLDYDEWWRLIAAIHHASEATDEGRELAHIFSEKSEKYEHDKLNGYWDGLKLDRGEGAVITAQTIFRFASQRYDWVDRSIGDTGFEVHEPERLPAPASVERVGGWIAAGLYSELPPTRWIIKGVLAQTQLAMIYGPPGSGKTFFAIDLALSIARGLDWNGKRTKQMRVGYVAAEDAGGIVARLLAYRKYHDVALGDALMVMPRRVNLFKQEEVVAFGKETKRAGDFGLLFVDTQAASIAGADENSSADMTVVHEHCKLLSEHTGALIMLIHHPGKNGLMRGSSTAGAVLETIIRVERNGELREAHIEKSKAGIDGARFGFKLNVVHLGVDEDGDPITSCVVLPTMALTNLQRDTRPHGEIERTVQACTLEFYDDTGVWPLEDELMDRYLAETVKPAVGLDRRRQYARQALKRMVERGAVICREGRFEMGSAKNAEDLSAKDAD